MNEKVFKKIADVIPTMHGWAELDKCITLASLVIGLRPSVIVEIGVWGGRSLIPMALACKEIGKGVVYAIDPWMSQVSAEGQAGDNLKWWSTANHEAVYNDFVSHVRHLGLQSIVRIHRMKSDDFDPPGSIDIAHVDGNHGPQAVKDVRRFAPSIVRGGFMVMDDLNWDGGNVGKAAAMLEGFGFRMLYPLGTGAVYQRVK